MSKKVFTALSIGCFGAAILIFFYLLMGNVAVFTGQISMAEAVYRWRLLPFIFLFFIAGMVFAILSIRTIYLSNKRSAQSRYSRKSGVNYTNGNGSYNYKPNGDSDFTNNHFNFQSMDDLTRQQYDQFMDEMNWQQQQFVNEMNRQQQQFMDEMNRQQNQQFMDWSMQETMNAGIPFEMGGHNMDHGNSFNMDNSFNNGF